MSITVLTSSSERTQIQTPALLRCVRVRVPEDAGPALAVRLAVLMEDVAVGLADLDVRALVMLHERAGAIHDLVAGLPQLQAEVAVGLVEDVAVLVHPA